MKTPLPTIAIGAALLFTSASPVLGEDETLPRTAWQKAEPAPGQTVRWVVEGCAAYPVVVDAEPEARLPEASPKVEAAMATHATPPSVPR